MVEFVNTFTQIHHQMSDVYCHILTLYESFLSEWLYFWSQAPVFKEQSILARRLH